MPSEARARSKLPLKKEDGQGPIAIARAPRPATVAVRRRRGRYVVDVSLPGPAGHRRRHRQKFEKRVTADAYADTIRERLRNGLEPFATLEEARPRPTMRELLAWNEEVHVKHVESERSRKEMLDRHSMIRRYPLADLEAESLTVFDLLDYRRARMEKRKGAKRTSEKGVRPDLIRLRAVLNAALKAEPRMISRNVFDSLSRGDRANLFPAWQPKPDFSAGQVIPPEEWERILAAFPEDDFNRALRFMDATGCRLGQAVSLDWSRYTDIPAGFHLLKQKKADRFVSLTSLLREIVGERKKDGPVFDRDGRLRKRLEDAWRSRRRRLGMIYRLHDIRHTVGTALRDSAGVENGASALGVTPGMMGIYGEHNKVARDAAVLEAVQQKRKLGTNAARLPVSAVSESN